MGSRHIPYWLSIPSCWSPKGPVFPVVGVLYTVVWVKNGLWAHPCLSVSHIFPTGVPIVGTHCCATVGRGSVLEHVQQRPQITFLQKWPQVQEWPQIALVQQLPIWCVKNNTSGLSVYCKEYTFPILFSLLSHASSPHWALYHWPGCGSISPVLIPVSDWPIPMMWSWYKLTSQPSSLQFWW
jgi:hypothetical protein